jgi:hypothetical protein
MSSGCEPLTPDDIAEVIVFTAGRRENVVVADSLIYPNHQISNLVTLLTRIAVSNICSLRSCDNHASERLRLWMGRREAFVDNIQNRAKNSI